MGSCRCVLLRSAGQLVETTAQGRPGAALVKQWSLAEVGPHLGLLGPSCYCPLVWGADTSATGACFSVSEGPTCCLFREKRTSTVLG